MEQRKPKQLVRCCQGNKLLFLLKYLLPKPGGKNPPKLEFALKKKKPDLQALDEYLHRYSSKGYCPVR